MAAPTPTHQRRLAEAVYVLRLTQDGREHPVPGNPVAGQDGSFVFAAPPQAITPRQDMRVGYHPTREGAHSDTQGASPPEWEIQGQFLLTPRSVGGRPLDGYSLQRALEHYVRYYAEHNRTLAASRQALLTMEFHDFYAAEHWHVVPLVVPMGQRSNTSPLTERYTLRLRGTRPAGAISRPTDRVRVILDEQPNLSVQAICPHEDH